MGIPVPLCTGKPSSSLYLFKDVLLVAFTRWRKQQQKLTALEILIIAIGDETESGGLVTSNFT